MNRPAGFDAPTWDPSWLTADDARAQRNAPAPIRPRAATLTPTALEAYELSKLRQKPAHSRAVAAFRAIGAVLGTVFLVGWSAVWFAFL